MNSVKSIRDELEAEIASLKQRGTNVSRRPRSSCAGTLCDVRWASEEAVHAFRG